MANTRDGRPFLRMPPRHVFIRLEIQEIKWSHAVAAAVIGVGAVSGAWAQSSVTLYGSMDAGVAYVNNVGGHAKWAMIQGNTQPDRWGLKGKEDLGDGLSAIFQLENGFYTNNGQFATANTIWNRAAFVGLGSERYGTLTLGRQTPLSFDYLDPLSTAYLAMSWYAFHPGNIDGRRDRQRAVQQLGQVPLTDLRGLSAAATMALGNTTNSTGKSVGVALNYANGPFKASAVYSNEHDRAILISTTGITSFQGRTPRTATPRARSRTSARARPTSSATSSCTACTRARRCSRTAFRTRSRATTRGELPQQRVQHDRGRRGDYDAGRPPLDAGRAGDIYALSKRTQLYANVLYEHGSGGAKAAFFTAGVSSTANQVIVLTGIHHSF